MAAIDILKTGNLADTLAALKDEVRNDPSEARHRVFLFQLLAVLGDWEKAATQLQVVKDLDQSALMMVQAYEQALNCERLRAAVFRSERSPLVFGEPEPWIAELIEALRVFNEGEIEKSIMLRDKAFEAAPMSSGRLTQFSADEDESGAKQAETFQWFADADPRLGPVLEAVVNGRLYWVPVSRISKIKFEKPTDLRDFVWAPAEFTWVTGGETVGFIPTRYPGSEAAESDQIRLARKTDWVDKGNDLYIPLGQRMVTTDVAEYPLLDIRMIEFDTEVEPENAGA